MNIPDVETFTIRVSNRDAYGKVTSVVDTDYMGMIERQTQFRGRSPVVTLGEGMVFSSNIEGLAIVGQEIIIDTSVWTIVQSFDAKDIDGAYHHTELIYG
jgi:hypothetical protein